MKIIKLAMLSIAFMLAITAITNADEVSLISSTNQIYTYQISISKLNDTPPIFQFLLANSTGTPYIYPASQNCTITNVITCDASFLKNSGIYDTILVYQNAKLYEKLPLNPSDTIYNPQAGGQVTTTITTVIPSKNTLIIGLIAVVVALILGNILYYAYKVR
jgi:hypothetical protein